MHKSLHLKIPHQPPFDKENWFESFVGNFVKPLLETGIIGQYWFSRYGSSGDRDVKFRFSLDDYSQLEPTVNELTARFGLTDLKDEEEHVWEDDLGGNRFFQTQNSESSKNVRSQLALNYLHSISQVFVDCLSQADDQLYFYQEKNTADNNPHGSIFESLHHLLCNMTDVVIEIVVARIDGKLILQSPLYFTQWEELAGKEGKTIDRIGNLKVKF